MTAHAVAERLWLSVHQLRDDMVALRLQAVEDHPHGDSSKLIDDVGATVEALTGWAQESLDGAARVLSASAYPADLIVFQRALDECSTGVERLGSHLVEELTATRRIDELGTLGRRGSPELAGWVAAIKDAVDQVQRSLWAVHAPLITCWRELAERIVPGPSTGPADTLRRT